MYYMLQAYYDESGIQQGSQICVIAGFYGPHSEWVRFDAQWNKINRDYDLPEFHAVKFWARNSLGNRVPPYSELSDQRADKYLEKLVSCIQRNRVFPSLHGILVDDWKKLPLNDRRYLTGADYKNGRFRSSGSPNKCYYLPFQYCVFSPLHRCPDGKTVRYYFGLDRTFSDYAGPMYKAIRKAMDLEVRAKMGECEFPLAKDTPALQAADMLVYEAYQNAKAHIERKNRSRELMGRLIKRMKEDERTAWIDTTALHRIAAKTRETAFGKTSQ
jgi:hypothetical protein